MHIIDNNVYKTQDNINEFKIMIGYIRNIKLHSGFILIYIR